MSKRSRGSRRAQNRRPGGRPGNRPARHAQNRPAQRPEPRRADIVEFDDEVDELDSVEPARASERPATVVTARSRARPSSALAARAATEYVYVAQDVRRIIVVAAILFAVMFVLWFLIVVARVVPL